MSPVGTLMDVRCAVGAVGPGPQASACSASFALRVVDSSTFQKEQHKVRKKMAEMLFWLTLHWRWGAWAEGLSGQCLSPHWPPAPLEGCVSLSTCCLSDF